jgi:hypothetical protein
MTRPRPLAARFPGLLVAGLALCAPALRAHDTLSFDPNAKPEFASNADPTLAPLAPVVIQGMASARLRPDDLEIDLTVADGFAYKLLDHDPYEPPVNTTGSETANPEADSSSGLPIVHDPHFTRDKQLLSKRGETLFIITSNGATLAPLAVAVDLTETQDVVFHITYPRPVAGPLRLEMTYFNLVPTGQKDMVTVLDTADKTIASTSVGSDTPYLDVDVPNPNAAPVSVAIPAATPRPAAKSGNTLSLILGTGAGLAVLFFCLKFLRRPARG